MCLVLVCDARLCKPGSSQLQLNRVYGWGSHSHPLQGTSPAASLKRERLVNRNAILRRTGFLEGSQGAAFLGAPQSTACCTAAHGPRADPRHSEQRRQQCALLWYLAGLHEVLSSGVPHTVDIALQSNSDSWATSSLRKDGPLSPPRTSSWPLINSCDLACRDNGPHPRVGF